MFVSAQEPSRICRPSGDHYNKCCHDVISIFSPSIRLQSVPSLNCILFYVAAVHLFQEIETYSDFCSSELFSTTLFGDDFVCWNCRETTASCRRAETLTTGTQIQTQWQTLWWHLLLLRESTSALNKACNHAVVTREQTKQRRLAEKPLHKATFPSHTNAWFCLSAFSLSAISL